MQNSGAIGSWSTEFLQKHLSCLTFLFDDEAQQWILLLSSARHVEGKKWIEKDSREVEQVEKKESEWKGRNVKKSSMKLCLGLSTAENVPRFRTHHLQSKQRRMERQLKIRWTRENTSFEHLQGSDKSIDMTASTVEASTLWEERGSESNKRINLTSSVWGCKQVLEPSERRASQNLIRAPLIKVAIWQAPCESGSKYLLRGDRVRFWLHACFTLPTPIYQTASKFSYAL